MTTKLDELMKKMIKINISLDKIANIIDKYEQFMQDRITHDEIVAQKN